MNIEVILSSRHAGIQDHEHVTDFVINNPTLADMLKCGTARLIRRHRTSGPRLLKVGMPTCRLLRKPPTSCTCMRLIETPRTLLPLSETTGLRVQSFESVTGCAPSTLESDLASR